MRSTVNETRVATNKKTVRSFNWLLNWKFITGCIIVIIALVFSGIYYHQTTRFNAQIKINGTNVGGLTAQQALNKLQAVVLKNEVFVGQEQIVDGKDTKMAFTTQDLSGVKQILKSQMTFLPSTKAKNYSLLPSEGDHYRSQTLKKQVEEKLTAMNKSLQPPQDAEARLAQGKIIVTKSISGKQLDVASILKQYENQEYNSVTRLKPVYIQANDAVSQKVQKQKSMLEQFLQQTVDYKVQDKIYPLKASDLIKNATVSTDMKVVFDSGGITNKIAEINGTQSTLNKNYSFKNHAGTMISVKGATYGWSLDVAAESKRVKDAFEQGEKTLSAQSIHGVGWSHLGTGYQVTTNNGIGDTYAEVSIREQRIWLYKNGKMVLTTPVVTGWHGVNQDTPTGVWYIEYKQSPSILTGSEVGNLNYRVQVTYWAPFTLSGCGFHDASWRRNWSSTAYLTNGSGGCVNVPPSVMKSVYDNLSPNEPVVIY